VQWRSMAIKKALRLVDNIVVNVLPEC
jgi:hypothetical protein